MLNSELIKKPIDYFTGISPEKCSNALFPEDCLCSYEPEIIVKLYDSLLFQNPNTAIFIRDYSSSDDSMISSWKSLGEPTVIITCPRIMANFKKDYPNIPVDSIYDVLIDLGISGGCNCEEYILYAPEDISEEFLNPVRALAEDMGVRFVEETAGVPYITCSISDRNKLKAQGKDAAHIFELIYGMGDSNTHLIHEDSNHNECDGNCAECSQSIDCEYEAGGQMVSIDAPVKKEPSPLPDKFKLEANVARLIDTLNMLFWNTDL